MENVKYEGLLWRDNWPWGLEKAEESQCGASLGPSGSWEH